MDAVDVRRGLACALVTVAAAMVGAQSPEPKYKSTIPLTHPALAALPSGGDAVARLVERLGKGEFTLLRRSDGQGYLPAVLSALDVPIDTQMLVFSKTSVQAVHTSPERPRAVYFRDDVMVAHVPGTPGVEAIAIDPIRGPVFYALTVGAGGSPTFTASQTCLKCHHGPNTAGVPGIYVGSVIPGPTGAPLRGESAIITDHTSAFADRWGGWYVTARRGEQRDRANAVASNPADPASLVRESKQNLTTLFGFIDPTTYLAPTSDIVALMTFEHQTQMTNLLTRVAWQFRIAEHAAPGWAIGTAELTVDLDDLARYMTFADEAPLVEPVEGVSSFARTFPARGPRDLEGRSLRDFDLQTRLFRYPLSYLVYSPAFDTLPEPLRREVYRRVYERLRGPAGSGGGPSRADRLAALEIARQTKADVPDFWRPPG